MKILKVCKKMGKIAQIPQMWYEKWSVCGIS